MVLFTMNGVYLLLGAASKQFIVSRSSTETEHKAANLHDNDMLGLSEFSMMKLPL
jgi:hypothetical protein